MQMFFLSFVSARVHFTFLNKTAGPDADVNSAQAQGAPGASLDDPTIPHLPPGALASLPCPRLKMQLGEKEGQDTLCDGMSGISDSSKAFFFFFNAFYKYI